MRRKQGKNLFVYLAAPVFIQWGIGLLAGAVAGILWVLQTGDPSRTASYLQQYATELTVASSVCAIPVFWKMYAKDSKMRGTRSEIGGVSGKTGLLIAVFGMSICVLLNSIISLSGLTGISSGYQSVSVAVYQSSLGVQLIGLGIVVPVAEEMAYRALLFRRVRDYVNSRTAILFSALIFGVFHGNLVQFVYAGVLGCFLAWIYENKGMLAAPFLLHMVINITSVMITRIGAFSWMFASVGRAVGVTAVAAVLSYTSAKLLFSPGRN